MEPITQIPASHAQGDIVYAILSHPLSVQLFIIGALCIGIMFICIRIMKRVGQEAKLMRKNLVADTHALATIEFALVFPILLTVAMMLAQTTMLMGGNIMVHYSAFAATRSAVVQIPRQSIDNNPNEITMSFGYSKFDAIHRAAVLAVMPVSGTEGGGSGGNTSSGLITQGLNTYYQMYGQTAPPWVTNLIGPKLAYAEANTDIVMLQATTPSAAEVSLIEIPAGSTVSLRPKDPVTIRVDHRFSLGIPYANRIYADGQGTGGMYANIRVHATLSNEGIIDTLPPIPDLPRYP